MISELMVLEEEYAAVSSHSEVLLQSMCLRERFRAM
ncbi:hypothetical protein P4O66_019068 [Electrophorus voltai]|uniref:Uncharacterized protein n=1 Tax=Electrophorus voltai TaxID=2609070 RepID=A0AAD9DMF0_9TELE|nr:hypothetical protein P4O66_019068 [Electrophorus voltai]